MDGVQVGGDRGNEMKEVSGEGEEMRAIREESPSLFFDKSSGETSGGDEEEVGVVTTTGW